MGRDRGLAQTSETSLRDFVLGITGGRGGDDVVVSVPIGEVMAEADTLRNPDAMRVFFAGVLTAAWPC